MAFNLMTNNRGVSRTSSNSGSGSAYGSVPSSIAIPANTYTQVGNVYPNLAGQTAAASGVVGNELAGQLSPETIAAIQNNAARFGVTSGMPGSQFSGQQGLANLGLNVEAMQRQGLQDQLSELKGIGATQTPQDLAASIEDRNSVYAASPDPAAAAQQQMDDWLTKFHATQNAANQNPNASRGGGYTLNGAAPKGQSYSTSAPEGGGYYSAPQLGPYTDYNTQPAYDNWAKSQAGIPMNSGYGNTMDMGGGSYADIATGDLYEGNQPTSSGSMYVSPQSEWYDPTQAYD